MTKLKVNRLPSLPHVLVDMLHACQGSHASFQDISLIISRDASIAARVISLANSSFYNRGNQINTLDRALLVLGTDTIKTIVITASVQQFFSGFNTDHTQFLKQFWKHSLSCALIAKSLAILTSYPNPEEAYLTGLLHNIGELVLDSNYPEQFSEFINQKKHDLEKSHGQQNESLHLQQEKSIFSVNHAEVGAWLAKEWDLSDFTADAIEFHHASSDAVKDAHHLVKLIYLASHLSINSNKVNLTPDSDDIGYQLFELNSALVNEIVLKIETEVLEVAATLGIDINSDESDQQTQITLAQHVRNIGLLQTATGELNRANSKVELGRAFQSTLELLFSYSNSAVFWYQPKDNVLSFIMPEHPESLPIKFKLEANRSLIAAAALENNILCSFDNESPSGHHAQLPVVDQQIIHLVKAKGLICIPIQSNSTLFCVLVVGCHQALDPFSNQAQLLKYFADEIASACEDTLTHISANENKVSSDEMSLRAHEIAHEANNPLNIINNYLVSLAQKLPAKDTETQEEIQTELNIVREEVERTSQILLRLKDLKHDTSDKQSGVNINNEIESLCALFKSSLFLLNEISYELNLDPNTAHNIANRNQLRQVLTNLIKNSVEAMPKEGMIKISTIANVNVNGQEFVEISIEDSGPGIPQNILKDLFTPVISTKGDGHSGLGLSITKNLVKDAKGTISCRSNETGTVFQILLPHVR